MERVLAWDTSGRFGVLSAFEINGSAGSYEVRTGQVLQVDQKQHSEGLFIAIQEALDFCSWDFKDLTALGVGVGPGSFTGVRVGLTAARTFAQVLSIPLIPFSSLALRSRQARKLTGHQGPLTLCVEACMGEVYLREERAVDEAEAGVKESVQKVRDWVRDSDLSNGLWVSAERYRDLQPSGWRWLESQSEQSSGWVEALISEVLAAHGAHQGRPALEVSPAYLRAPDAELKLRARLQG